jgi:hypothetical protein
VIVTEALHIPVIIFGISATIAAAWWQLSVPLGTALGDRARSGRINIFDFSIDPRAPHTVWTVVLGVSVGSLTNYIGDQMSLQRYLVTGDVRSASRSFAVNVIGVVIVVTLLTLVGLSMYVYYSHTVDPTLPTRSDEVFPHFVATRLPVGVAGLLLAALLASTGVLSGINALAAVLTLDLHARLRTGMMAAQQVWWGRFYSLMIGLLATLTAGVVSKLGTLFELSQRILGLFAGPILSCVVVAVGGWRCTGGAMVIGMLLGWLVGIAVTGSGAAAPWVAPSSALTTLVTALALSRFRSSARIPEDSAVRSELDTTTAACALRPAGCDEGGPPPPAPFAGPLLRHIGFDLHHAAVDDSGRACGRSARQNGMPRVRGASRQSAMTSPVAGSRAGIGRLPMNLTAARASSSVTRSSRIRSQSRPSG